MIVNTLFYVYALLSTVASYIVFIFISWLVADNLFLLFLEKKNDYSAVKK